jgi:vacuolar-type H+-ATPase subunit E/Vma4
MLAPIFRRGTMTMKTTIQVDQRTFRAVEMLLTEFFADLEDRLKHLAEDDPKFGEQLDAAGEVAKEWLVREVGQIG